MSVSAGSSARCRTAQDDIVIARCDDLATFLGKAVDRDVEKERAIVASVRTGKFFQFGTNEFHSADRAYDVGVVAAGPADRGVLEGGAGSLGCGRSSRPRHGKECDRCRAGQRLENGGLGEIHGKARKGLFAAFFGFDAEMLSFLVEIKEKAGRDLILLTEPMSGAEGFGLDTLAGADREHADGIVLRPKIMKSSILVSENLDVDRGDSN